MKKIICCFILSIITTHSAVAMQCPDSSGFQHQIVPNTPPQPWAITTTYVSQGWSIINNLMEDSSPLTNIPGNAVLKVEYVQASLGTQNYGIICSYQIETSSEPIFLDVQNSNIFSAPNNSNFKKLDDGRYLCETTAGTPEKCAASNVNSVIFGR